MGFGDGRNDPGAEALFLFFALFFLRVEFVVFLLGVF
jgi:hypothetical protein